VIDEASDLKFGRQLEFVKAHHQIPLEEKWVWPWDRKAPRNLGLPFNITAMAEVSDLKFGAPLGFAKSHHQTAHRRRMGESLG